jgi:hypothetical protein
MKFSGEDHNYHSKLNESISLSVGLHFYFGLFPYKNLARTNNIRGNMYKALDKRTNVEIIILDPQWEDRLEQLRSMGRSDQLVCQGCLQPVRFRAGEIRHPHFAHKHLQGCSFGKESPKILVARAILYRWLQQKYPGNVSIEKNFTDLNLPRPIDCWVRAKKKVFAYWIIDRKLRAETRGKLHSIFNKLRVGVQWVFLSDMLEHAQNHEGCISLSTTERDFLFRSKYDEIILGNSNWWKDVGQTIHYLDIKNEKFLSYRSLDLVHSPSIFSGIKKEHLLQEMMISPKNGEFVHPGEHEQLKLVKEEIERHRMKLKSEENQITKQSLFVPNQGTQAAASFRWKYREDDLKLEKKDKEKGICIYCGELTDNWWHIWSENGVRKCKCRDCRDRSI